MPGFVAAIVAIFAVHRLTRGREREKMALDLYKQIIDQLAPLKAAAVEAWATPGCKERVRAESETIWRMQSVAATCARLSAVSRRRPLGSWPPRRLHEIGTSRLVIRLRQALTNDPFEDITQPPAKAHALTIEDVIGEFVAELDAEVTAWAGRTYR